LPHPLVLKSGLAVETVRAFFSTQVTRSKLRRLASA
jgi:hypothetical protein